MNPWKRLIDILDFSKGGGLLPVIVQDIETREVLMLAYTNREAVEKTIETGYAHFWSRSRGRLWMKGESSGSVMKVERILVDCDGDAIIYLVKPSGPSCHTGNRTCFFRSLESPSRNTSKATANQDLPEK